MCREYVDEERTEKQVAAVMQKTLEHQGSHGQKFYYAMNRSAQAIIDALIADHRQSSAFYQLLMHHTTMQA